MSGGAKCSPHSCSACSSAATTSSRPRKSARANGPGIMPVPIISARSTSRTPATPSSTTRHASTIALSVKRSAIRSSSRLPGSIVLIEPPAALGPEVAALDALLHALVDVETVAVGVAHVAGNRHDGVEAGHVGHAERAHRHLDLFPDELVELLHRHAGLVLIAPDLRRDGGQDAIDHEAGAFERPDRHLADLLREP